MFAGVEAGCAALQNHVLAELPLLVNILWKLDPFFDTSSSYCRARGSPLTQLSGGGSEQAF